MSHGTTPPQPVPVLTELIEYEGDRVTVRSITPVDRDGGNAEFAGVPFRDAPIGPMSAAPGPAVSLDGPLALATCETPPLPFGLLLSRVDAALEAQLCAALTPVFEQVLRQAMEAARGALAEAIADITDQLPYGAAGVSTPQRGPAPQDTGEASP